MLYTQDEDVDSLDWVIRKFEEDWIVGLDYKKETPISFKGE